MSQIVYVNEYQPSSACLRLTKDSIYKQSMDDEQIRVGLAAPPTSLLALLALGVILVLVVK